MTQLKKVAVWKRQDGGISITYFDDRDKLVGESDDDFVKRYCERLKKNPMFQGVEPEFSEKKDIPTDRSERDHWCFKNGKFEVDQIKAAAARAKKEQMAKGEKKL